MQRTRQPAHVDASMSTSRTAKRDAARTGLVRPWLSGLTAYRQPQHPPSLPPIPLSLRICAMLK
eukprot:3461987-Pleurochrysis_carterae.AAC.2